MQTRKDYRYEAYDTPEVKKIRIPQQEWTGGAPPPGANGLEVAQGVVSSFDVGAGFGMISTDASDREVFFSFTAIPGEGYRTPFSPTPRLTDPTSRLSRMVSTCRGERRCRVSVGR
jgi:hypothetical protein